MPRQGRKRPCHGICAERLACVYAGVSVGWPWLACMMDWLASGAFYKSCDSRECAVNRWIERLAYLFDSSRHTALRPYPAVPIAQRLQLACSGSLLGTLRRHLLTSVSASLRKATCPCSLTLSTRVAPPGNDHWTPADPAVMPPSPPGSTVWMPVRASRQPALRSFSGSPDCPTLLTRPAPRRPVAFLNLSFCPVKGKLARAS